MSRANRCRRSAAAFAICMLVACSSPEERFAKHVERAERLAEAGEIEDAILEYRSALKIDPENSDANERLGNLLLRRGDLERDLLFQRGHSPRSRAESTSRCASRRCCSSSVGRTRPKR